VWTAARTAEFWTRLEASIDDGMLPHDKFKAWRRKELRPGKVMVWTPEQTGQFLDHVAADRLSALFELVVDTGTRRGEFTGLRWIDVDLDNGVIDVTHTRVTIGWEVIDETPKSEAGERSVPISQSTVAALRKWRAQQSRERLAWGEAWVDSGLVFTREDGSPLHPGVVSNHFRRLAYDAGLPPVALHGMRHGSATYLLAAGVDVKVVQARLGHSTSTLTRDTYTSVLDEVARAAAEAARGDDSAGRNRNARTPYGHPHGYAVARTALEGEEIAGQEVGRLGLEPRTHGLKVGCPIGACGCVAVTSGSVPRVSCQVRGLTAAACGCVAVTFWCVNSGY
jgi:integrase